jgi:hypothetical protein
MKMPKWFSLPSRHAVHAFAAATSLWLAPAAPAWSQAADAASAPMSPAKRSLVQKVVELQMPGIDGFARSVLRETISPMLTTANQLLNTQVPADRRQATRKAIEDEVKKYFDTSDALMRDKTRAVAKEMLPAAINQQFSEDELRQLITWLESPVSRKYAQLQPQVQQALGRKVVTDVRQTLQPRAAELERAVIRHLNLKPGAVVPSTDGAASR